MSCWALFSTQKLRKMFHTWNASLSPCIRSRSRSLLSILLTFLSLAERHGFFRLPGVDFLTPCKLPAPVPLLLRLRLFCPEMSPLAETPPSWKPVYRPSDVRKYVLLLMVCSSLTELESENSLLPQVSTIVPARSIHFVIICSGSHN